MISCSQFLLEGLFRHPETQALQFDVRQDTDQDILHTKLQPFHNKLARRHGLQMYIAYKPTAVASYQDVTSLEHVIKYEFDKYPAFQQLLNKAIVHFNRIVPVAQFDIILTPKSTSSLNARIAHQIQHKAGKNTLIVTNAFVKNVLNQIQIDFSKVKSEKDRKTLEKMFARASQNGTMEMKKISPRFRGMVSNLIIFRDQISRHIFNAILHGKVLIVDDIYTTGTTLQEIKKLLNAYTPKEIVVFVFFSPK